MNAKLNSIEAAIAIRPITHIRSLVEPVAYAVPVRILRLRDTLAPASTRAGIGLQLAAADAGEFWETLSYALLWVAGLAGVAVCFR